MLDDVSSLQRYITEVGVGNITRCACREMDSVGLEECRIVSLAITRLNVMFIGKNVSKRIVVERTGGKRTFDIPTPFKKCRLLE